MLLATKASRSTVRVPRHPVRVAAGVLPTLLTWLVTITGAVTVVLVLRDLFHTIWHPSGHGLLAPLVMRGTWRATRSLGERARSLAGPLGILLVMVAWASLAVLGWALVFLPHLPGSFSYATGLLPDQRSMPLDALYLALVTVTTAGFGDIVPVEGWLRAVTPLAALMGITLVTAAVTWVLQLYPALARRRVLAVRVRLLAGELEGNPAAAGLAQLPTSTVHELASAVTATRIDFTQYAEGYWFFDRPDTALAAGLPVLLRLADAGRDADRSEQRVAAAVLRGSLDDLAATLDRQFLHSDRDTAGVLAMYAERSGQPGQPESR